MYSNVLNQEFQNEEYGNSSTKRYKINSHKNEPSYKTKYNSIITVTSKYIKNPKLSSSMKKNHQDNKEVSNKSKNLVNLFSYYKTNKKEQKNIYKTFSHQNENSTSNLNPSSQNYEPLQLKSTCDGVLRGFTNNCSFYVSGSFDLQPRTSIKNKTNNPINNYNRINDKTNISNYISNKYKTRNVMSTTPDSYRRRDMLKDIKISFNPKNENLYSKNSYDSNSHKSNKITYYSIKSYKKNKVEKMNYKGYQFPIIQKKVIDKIKEKKLSPDSNSRKFYFSSKSIDNLKKYDQRNRVNNIKQLVPLNNYKINDKRESISNNNDIKIYQTSSNKSSDGKKKINVFNYFKKIEEKKPIEKKRNHTPNIVRIEIKHTNSKNKNEKINNNYRYKNGLEENLLNKTEKFYKPNNKYHHFKINSVNFTNKNRYNFTDNIKLREYETKTEVYSFNNVRKNNRESLNLNYAKKVNNITNYKSIEKKDYENRYNNISNYYSRSGRQYGLRTEIQKKERNKSQDNEYEVTDISIYKKRNQKNKSTDKINIKIKEPIKIINNRKEIAMFERSLRNIRDNEREIKKDNKNFEILRGDNSHNHTVFESNNFSKQKRIFKTSTQKQVNRSKVYSLKDEDEKNRNYKQVSDYKKISENSNQNSNRKNKSSYINKNNYYNVMKNLEEEIEIEDEQDQVEYISLEQLHKKNQKQKMKNIRYNKGYILTSKKKEENKNNYYNAEKDEKNTKRIKISYCQPTQINNNIFYKSLKIKVPKKKKIVNSNRAQNEKEEQNKRQNITVKKIQIKQNQQYFPKNKINPQYAYQETHQQMSFIDKNNKKANTNTNEDENEKDQIEEQPYSNNVFKTSKYSSYFGDSNNNYYEIKGPSNNKYKDEEQQTEEEEENESPEKNSMHFDNQDMQFVRSDNFGIQSENLYVPAEEDKDDKEADEQIYDEDEQEYINNDVKNENDGNEMEKIDEETENEIIHENDEEGEDDESEKGIQNKIEEENIIEEKNEEEETEHD